MTAAPELPDWALQLLLAVQQHEDEHADDQPCLAQALNAVPADITRYAAAIDAHTRPLREQLKVAELATNAGESYRKVAEAAMDRVRQVTITPELMDSNESDIGSYKRGYRQGVLAAQSALRDPRESTAKTSMWSAMADLCSELATDAPSPQKTDSAFTPVSDDHPCAHCGHARRAHITGPVWCRHCPAQTSGPDQPGWHQYTPAKEQL